MKEVYSYPNAFQLHNKGGFTFIEILIAIAIFVMAVLAAVNIAAGSVKATQDSKDVTMATWLLQQKMVELETKLESEGIKEGCVEEEKGKFEAPHERFSWVTICQEIDFYLSQTAAKLAQSSEEDGEDSEKDQTTNQITEMVLQKASDFLGEAVRELHVEVYWIQAKADRSVSATTHFADYNTKVSLGLGGLGGQQTGQGGSQTSGGNN